MAIRILAFLALVLTATCLVPSGAHLAELGHKINLPADNYLIVQKIYRGWQYFDVPIAAAILATAALARLLHDEPAAFGLTLAACLLITAGLVVFFVFVFPANQATANRTSLPSDWQALRARWEFGHAANAIMTLLAFVLLVLATLVRRGGAEDSASVRVKG